LNTSEYQPQPAVACRGFPLNEVNPTLKPATGWDDGILVTLQGSCDESGYFIANSGRLCADASFELHLDHPAGSDALSIRSNGTSDKANDEDERESQKASV